MIAEFNEKEDTVFQQAVEWFLSRLSNPPVFIQQKITRFQIDPFTRTFVNDIGENIYLTKDRYLQKTNYMKMYGVSTILQREATSHHL